MTWTGILWFGMVTNGRVVVKTVTNGLYINYQLDALIIIYS